MMREFIVFISIILISGCAGTGNNVKQNSYERQNKSANEAFKELDKETGGKALTEQELEILEEEMKSGDNFESKEKPEEGKSDNGINRYPEKKRPAAAEQKSLPDSDYPMKNGKPVWFFNPTYNGYLGAVGVAKKSSVNGGFGAQKKLAKTLAQAELIKMLRVVVNTELKSERIQISSDVYSHYRSKFRSLSVHSAEGVVKNAVVKDVWVEKETGDLYLWLVMKK
ncbi:MAG: hypothetical protein FXF49_04825 [Flexistipes sinusarabici]|uniref:Lipoprotein n=1 Tax=Flexistipes sinusarabici TaxID=2352 RepID=A0A5D0MPX8_FLESI|nr:hypothetical protein [Flexistipes sinusarabici]TYB33733.1 MAG: hypothetical protein FXF49_04825 [Flexistipes sinusarabici]